MFWVFTPLLETNYVLVMVPKASSQGMTTGPQHELLSEQLVVVEAFSPCE